MNYSILPKFLQVELTYACNSGCMFCYNPNRRKQPNESTRLQILENVNRYKLHHVQLIGGEVTTLPDLPQYLRILKDTKIRSIVTNGRIFMPETVDLVDEVYISIHGDKEMHEHITRVKNSFEIIENTIEKYVSAGKRVHSDSVLTKMNYDQIFNIAKYADEIGMHTLYVNIFQPAGFGVKNEDDLAPSLEQIRFAIGQLVKAKNELGINIKFGTSTPFCLDDRLVKEGLAFTCGTGTWFASIDPWGDLRICNQSTTSYGNVLDEQLGKIWHKKEIDSDYRSLSWLKAIEPCNSCVFKSDCLGGCRIDEKGHARIDPIVSRDTEKLLSQNELIKLKEEFNKIEYDHPYEYH